MQRTAGGSASSHRKNIQSHEMQPPKFAWALLLVLPAAVAHAEIYACAGKTGMTVYQNFTCDVDSLGSVSAPTKAAQAPAASNGRTGASAKTVALHGASSANTSGSVSEPRMGMSASEVKAIWGEPIDTSKEEFAKGDIETWTYADSRSVQFDTKGRVTSVKR
jgi:hypothetical protein